MSAQRVNPLASLQALLDDPEWTPRPPTGGSRRVITRQQEDDLQAYRAAVSRAKTTTYVDTLVNKPHPQTYANQMFQRVLSRLDRAQLRTNRMVQQRFHYILPADSATGEFRCLMHCNTGP